MLGAMRAERRDLRTMSTEVVARDVDRALAALAARQHGVVSRSQLRAIGIDDDAATYRARVGRLHRIHRGVYAVGHPLLSRRGWWMAAVLACGPGAVLSHAAAAALWDLRPSAAAKTDVSVRGAAGRSRRPRLRLHRMPTLLQHEVTTRDGIPVTTPARTLLDLARTLSRRELERALDQSVRQELFDRAALDAVIRDHAGERGVGRLRRALSTHVAGTTLTRSELEERFIAVCDAASIRRPRVNAYVAGLEVDFLFPEARLVVETDGWQFHRTRAQFERDRERDAILVRAGYRTLRFTHRQLTTTPHEVAQTLRAGIAVQRSEPRTR
jgi:very-short-patch-repair endonuclease